MQSLFAPWRYSYLVQEPPPVVECIFCNALAHPDADDSLIVYTGEHNFIILNLYPYNNGHLMIVPKRHVASLSESLPAARAEMIDLATVCETALRDTYRPDGINVGMNIGQAAGAGIEAHYHLHLVPRWAGDTNFMTVTAETRVIPEPLSETRIRVKQALEAQLGREGHAGR